MRIPHADSIFMGSGEPKAHDTSFARFHPFPKPPSTAILAVLALFGDFRIRILTSCRPSPTARDSTTIHVQHHGCPHTRWLKSWHHTHNKAITGKARSRWQIKFGDLATNDEWSWIVADIHDRSAVPGQIARRIPSSELPKKSGNGISHYGLRGVAAKTQTTSEIFRIICRLFSIRGEKRGEPPVLRPRNP
jgi:hypothetical protein